MCDIANDWDVCLDHFVDGGWIYIDVCFDRLGAECVQPSCDAVVKSCPDVDHQVAVVHGHIGLIKPMHAQHADPFVA